MRSIFQYQVAAFLICLIYTSTSPVRLWIDPINPDLVRFSFKQSPILPIVESLVQKKEATLILPQNAVDLEALQQQRMTYYSAVPLIPLKKAWSLINTFLELSGFSIAQEKESVYRIVRNSSIEGGAISREVLPLYIGTLPSSLPADDSRVRYIHYLKNLKVPSRAEKDSAPLTKMLKELLSKDASLVYEPQANAIIITDKASHIAATEELLDEFDNRGIKEAVVYIPLQNLPASEVVKIFNSLKAASGENDPQAQKLLAINPSDNGLTHLSQDTRIVADPNHNSVILMGREASVERIAEFIRDAIDVEKGSGSSILHYYNLQYLDAEKFAPQLQSLVSSVVPGTQATQAPLRNENDHVFKGVIILPEVAIELSKKFTTEEIIIQQKGFPEEHGVTGGATRGGNRLIIAAWQDDWKIIEAFIKKLDKPERQVILEMLLVEFTYDHRTQIAATTHNPSGDCGNNNGVEFLASFISPVNNVLGSTPTQLAQDLLSVVGPNNPATTRGPGSLLLSFNDRQTSGIFGLLQILNQALKTKIRAYPFITVTNNQKGIFESQEVRRSAGDLVTTTNGTFTIPIEDIPASIKIVTTPHIITDERLRLEIGLTFDEFRGAELTRVTRGLKTVATLASGQILAIGGIVKTDNNDLKAQTPVIGDIPILGLLFARTNNQTIRSNISLFILPTIIEPSRKNLADKTRYLTCKTREEVDTAFNERDPIVRLFFKEPVNGFADVFFDRSSNLNDFRLHTCNETPKLLERKVPKKPSRESPNFVKLREILALQSESPIKTNNRELKQKSLDS